MNTTRDPSPTNAYEDAEEARGTATDDREMLTDLITSGVFARAYDTLLGLETEIEVDDAVDAILAAGFTRANPGQEK